MGTVVGVACLAAASADCTSARDSGKLELEDETSLVQIHASLRPSGKDAENHQSQISESPNVACITNFGHLNGEWYEGKGSLNDESFYYKAQPSDGEHSHFIMLYCGADRINKWQVWDADL